MGMCFLGRYVAVFGSAELFFLVGLCSVGGGVCSSDGIIVVWCYNSSAPGTGGVLSGVELRVPPVV